jgi:O-antigen/teichoic acid export membrane protein
VKLPLGDKDTLVGRASRALSVSFLSNVGARVGTFAIGVVLARLLGPHEFGAYAVALVAVLAVGSFNELGISLAIVRWRGDPAEIVPTINTISVATSVFLYCGCFFGAPVFAAAMGAPQAAGVVRLLCLNVIVDGIVGAPAALLQRYFQQGRKMIADQVNNWLGAAVSIWLAWSGLGAMSLAIGRMTGAVTAGILFVAFSPMRLRFGFDRTHARALLRFGLPLAGSSLIVFAVSNMDQIVVGHVLGATALGFYTLAFNLASWPFNIFSIPVNSVAPALFSRMQHDPSAMRTVFVSGTGLLGSCTLPICVLISAGSIPLIGLFYGPRWFPASQALVWLAIFGVPRILFQYFYDFFVVLARSRVVFTAQLVWLVSLLPALVLGARYRGIAGVGMAELAIALCVLLPWYLTELHKVGIKWQALCAQLWAPVIGAVSLGLLIVVLSHVILINIAILMVGGILTLGTIGILLYKMQDEIAMIKPVLSAASVQDAQTDSVTQSAEQGGDYEDETPTVVFAAIAPMPASPGSPAAMPPPARERLRRPAAFDAMINAADATIPLPVFRELGGPLPIHEELTVILPRYQEPESGWFTRRQRVNRPPWDYQDPPDASRRPRPLDHPDPGAGGRT